MNLADRFFEALETSRAFHADIAASRAKFNLPPLAEPPLQFPATPGMISCLRTDEGLAYVQDEHGPRPYLLDTQNRRWLLDGSGDVA